MLEMLRNFLSLRLINYKDTERFVQELQCLLLVSPQSGYCEKVIDQGAGYTAIRVRLSFQYRSSNDPVFILHFSGADGPAVWLEEAFRNQHGLGQSAAMELRTSLSPVWSKDQLSTYMYQVHCKEVVRIVDLLNLQCSFNGAGIASCMEAMLKGAPAPFILRIVQGLYQPYIAVDLSFENVGDPFAVNRRAGKWMVENGVLHITADPEVPQDALPTAVLTLRSPTDTYYLAPKAMEWLCNTMQMAGFTR